MIFLLLVAFIPFMVRAIQIVWVTRMGGAIEMAEALRELNISPKTFFDYINFHISLVPPGMPLLPLLLVLAGSGLIVKDRKVNALAIYFSKPVSFQDYLSGKFLILSIYGLMITLIPAWILFVLRILVSQNMDFFRQFYWIPFSTLGYCLVIMMVLGGLILAFSATARSTRQASILFFAVLVFPELFRSIFPGSTGLGLLSPLANLRQVGAWMHGLARPMAYSPVAAIAVLAGILAVVMLVLWKKVRPTEVVR
jgi:ABC-type transport system involved in multi-copper enzyme maturation permease subunit